MKAFLMFSVKVAGAVFLINLATSFVPGTASELFWNPGRLLGR